MVWRIHAIMDIRELINHFWRSPQDPLFRCGALPLPHAVSENKHLSRRDIGNGKRRPAFAAAAHAARSLAVARVSGKKRWLRDW